MQWFGKGIGGLIGAFFGPVGSLLGVIIGHQWDQSTSGRGGSVREISRLFFETTFEVMGQVAKVDGRVSEDEVRVARRIMQGMRLTDAQVQSAIEHFTRGKSADYPLDARLAALAEQLGNRSDLARAFVQIQLQSAIGAGNVGADKRQVLWRVANALGVSRAELAQIEALIRGFERGGAAQSERAEPRGRVSRARHYAAGEQRRGENGLSPAHEPAPSRQAGVARAYRNRWWASPSRRRTRCGRLTSESKRSAASNSRAAQ